MGVQGRGIPRAYAHEVLMADDILSRLPPDRVDDCHWSDAGLLRVWNNSVSEIQANGWARTDAA
jgi:hypothetical protein